MAHSLPARPSFLPPPPDPVLPPSLSALSDLPEPEAGPSQTATQQPTCAICANPPKYTCPGCARKTCCLACSKAHKEAFGCSGQRDAAAYVPLKDVSEGVWADDYRYLEEGRRKIAQWGGSLPSNVLSAVAAEQGNSKGRYDRGVKRKRPGQTINGALVGLQREMQRRGVDIEFMADGMERRRKNQSGWNPKTQTLYMTIQLVLPKELAGGEEAKTIHHSRLAFSASSNLHTLHSLSPKDMDTENLVYALPYHRVDRDDERSMDVLKPGALHLFPPLTPTISVADALRGTAYIEFPTIRVFEKREWDEKLGKGEIVIHPLAGGATAVIGQSEPVQTEAPAPEPTSAKPQAQNEMEAEAPPASAPAPAPAPATLGLGLDYGSDEED